jgi:uncharacterized protein YbjT (DUF2867 family)
MTSNNKPIITVFGATGAQGGSVIDSLLASQLYQIRGVTRKVDDAKAASLASRGVEIVQGDIAADSVEKLSSALKGSYGAFLLTNFWDPSSMHKEVAHGKKLVDAAKLAGVKHIVWSTLPNVEKLSGSKAVPHFTDKAVVEEYIVSLQKAPNRSFDFATFAAPAFYFQNFQSFFPPKLEDNVVVFNLPETKSLTAFDVTETGLAVLNAFKNPTEFDGKRIDYYGTHQSPQEYVDTYAKVTGLKARLNLIPREVFAKFPFSGAEELAAMFAWFNDFTLFGPHGDREFGKKATENKLSTWEQFLLRTKWTGVAAV